jgi:sugar (pentulose or hexulose) kinase
VEYAIAVIDIGMTNKKVAVYDDALQQMDAQYKVFPPKIVKGNIESHDLEGMEVWFTERLKEYAAKYPIKALAVTTHGATFVCVGKDGKPALPCVFYTHEPGDEFYKRFYRRFGTEVELQKVTGTPAFKALINPAKNIMFSQETFPDEYKNVVSVLPYPQYWGFRFTGKIGLESTFMGNHSYLWDQEKNTLSSVAVGLGLDKLMPKTLYKSWDVLGTLTEEFAEKTGLSKDVIMTMGIHDSNSALLPHFAKKGDGGFVLNSTGTWCVIMKPMKKYGFAPEELGKVVLFNISAFGTPIKTTIFIGGQEFETWSKLFQKLHGRDDFPGWNEALYRKILAEKKLFLLPELIPGSGQFPQSKAGVRENGNFHTFEQISAMTKDKLPPCLADYETAFALLRISLVMQSFTGLERSGLSDGDELFVEGGFRKDKAYNLLCSAAYKNNRMYLTNIAEATAFGAAMTAKIALTGKTLKDLAGDCEIEYKEQEKLPFPELEPYREAWLKETDRR